MEDPLLHSPSDIAAQVLIDIGVAGDIATSQTVSWPVFVGSEPSTPDNCIVVQNIGGVPDGRIMFDGENHQHHGVLVRVRSTSESVGHTKARAIAHAIASKSNVYNRLTVLTSPSATYLVQCFSRIGDVVYNGKQANTARSVHTFDALIVITRT